MLIFFEVLGGVVGVLVIAWLISIPIVKHKKKKEEAKRLAARNRLYERLKNGKKEG